MKIYIFQYVEQLTNNFHSDGGLVIIAKDKKSAKKLIQTKEYIEITEDEWKRVVKHNVESNKEELYIFPDAGCC